VKEIAYTLALLSIPMLTLACHRTESSQTSTPSNPAAKAVSYKYEIRDAGTFGSGEAETIHATVGKNELSVQEGRLTVNGKAYGTLKDKDSILVDESGKVMVNGMQRSPE